MSETAYAGIFSPPPAKGAAMSSKKRSLFINCREVDRVASKSVVSLEKQRAHESRRIWPRACLKKGVANGIRSYDS
jgi:hypothetical protein